MSITKNVLLNWYSLWKKKLRKIPMIFDFESQILALFDTNSQNSIICFEYMLILRQNFSNFVSPLENSTTQTQVRPAYGQLSTKLDTWGCNDHEITNLRIFMGGYGSSENWQISLPWIHSWRAEIQDKTAKKYDPTSLYSYGEKKPFDKKFNILMNEIGIEQEYFWRTNLNWHVQSTLVIRNFFVIAWTHLTNANARLFTIYLSKVPRRPS